MSDILLPGALKKGSRVFARQLGKPDVKGVITWVGPNRYGPGIRYGVKADGGGGTHWFDDTGVELEVSEQVGGIQKGSRVRVTAGPHEGIVADVYLWGPTGRVGLRDDNEDTYWVEREQLELES